MKAIYFETSALLGWLLGEPCATEVKEKIDAAETIVTSILTLIEAEHAMIRAEKQNLLNSADAEKLRGLLARSKIRWTLMQISEEVQTRASRFFPIEPVKVLDAIHLATALAFLRVFPELELLSYDQRILENAGALGIHSGC